MPLTFTLRDFSPTPIEVDSIDWGWLREQSVDAIKSFPIYWGNTRPQLGELFDVCGSAADGAIVWRGDCRCVKGIGAGMRNGTMRVEGNAGMHLGAGMRGGEIVVDGNAADWVGAEMRGGTIHIQGNAGNLVGAVYRGGRRGMTGERYSSTATRVTRSVTRCAAD